MKNQHVANYVAGAGMVASVATGNVPAFIASAIAYGASAIEDDLEERQKAEQSARRDNKHDRLWAEANSQGDPCMWD